MRRALPFALPLIALLAGCPQAPSDAPGLQGLDGAKLAAALPPAPGASAAPDPQPSAALPREILPFRAGDRFEYGLRYYLGGFLGLPVGTLTIVIDQVEQASGVETIDLRLLPPFSAPEPHRIVLKSGMFHYDDKPFVPTQMRQGDSWPAQDGFATVVGRETIGVPVGQFPYCYRVSYFDPHTGDQMTFWFAPGVGLAKADFSLRSAGRGAIDLSKRPVSL